MAKIVILYSSAGFGLAKDAQVLKVALASLQHDVELQAFWQTDIASESYFKNIVLKVLFKFNLIYFWRKVLNFFSPAPTTIFIHLENIIYKKLYANAIHVLVPNQEWFRVTGIPLLPHIHSVWCKSKLAQHIFTELGVPTRYIGFSSGVEVLSVQTHSLKAEFFSRIGRSAYRGAEKLVSVWAIHPEWPTLNLVIDASRRIYPCPENVKYVDEFLSLDDYCKYSQRFLFQIFATETEGFGHAIYEGIASGATVLLTDAPPMNEVVNGSSVIFMGAKYNGHKGLSPRFMVTKEGIEHSVNCALQLKDDERAYMAANAKQTITQMDAMFLSNLNVAMNTVTAN